MQKSLAVHFLLPAFFLSACNSMLPRDDTDITPTYTKNTSVTSASEIIENPDSPSIANSKEKDVWKRIATDLRLTRDVSEKTTASKLAWFAKNQAYLDRVSNRAAPYLYYIVEELKKRDMPLDLALLPIAESAYNPFAYSPSHASGIWQFIPSTGKSYGLKQNWWYDARRDIVAATDAALNYLQKLHHEFNGDWLLALAAYNSGEGKVGKAVRRNEKAGTAIDFFSLKLPRETRAYVPSLLALAEIISNPSKYKITIKPIENSQYFEQVDIHSQIDLATAAELSELSIEEIYTLNPGFNRWATDPKGPHRLLIPVNKVTTFRNRLATLSFDDRMNWQQHKIQKGESLERIATRYKTNVATLKQINRFESHTIRTGYSLLIPVAKKPLNHYSLSLESRRDKGLKRSGNGQYYVYTVKPSDNLWSISRRYGVSVAQLCAWNALSSKSILQPKKKLKIWVKNSTIKIAKATTTAVVYQPLNTTNSQHFRYQVLQGDSLWLISQRFGVSVHQIKKWNNLSEAHYIKPGQLLVIYTGVLPRGA